MKSKSKILAIVIVAVLVMAATLTLVACNNNADEFTIWLVPNDAIKEKYMDLEKNPVIAYVQKKFDIKFKFMIPAKGSEADQFTLLTTDPDCPDVMDLSYYSGGMAELVEDGVALDLTDYIYPQSGDSYFPNYAAALNSHPEVKTAIGTLDNKFYSLSTLDDQMRAPWGGYMYRKDLVYKYATAADAQGDANPATWNDKEDIVFPSGAKAPDLISDYDWMFKILKRAVDAKELSYVMSLFYPGYIETGDMLSAWGISGAWYKEVVDGKTTVKYGPTSDAFKSYLKKMKEWYDLGYIDKSFTSKSDMFYNIDAGNYNKGNIGCYYGMYHILGDAQKGKDGVNPDIDLRACYMPRMDKDSEPISYYVDSLANRSLMINAKVMDKDYEKLFAALDYLYGEEGSLMTRMGLNKEQYAELKTDGVDFWDGAEVTLTAEEQQIAGVTSAKQKISDIGAYYLDTNLNKYIFWSEIETDTDKQKYEQCLSGMSFWGMCAVSQQQYIKLSNAQREAQYEIWNAYSNSGFIDLQLIPKKLTGDDSTNYTKHYNNLSDYLKQEVPKFIKGDYDIDSKWKGFTNDLKLKYCNDVTILLQSIYDAMEGR